MSDHESGRRCAYEHCDRPGESRRFHRIEEGTTTGGQDWSSVVGSVLCKACYDRFKKRGTLERAPPRIRIVGPCTYEHCERPGESNHFHRIEEGRTTGGQDWSSLVGSVLCESCHGRFKKRGTLERAPPQIKTAGPCKYEHCERPGESRYFYQIEEGRTTGGQDWSSLVGSVLCNACYGRFLSRGTLERAPPRIRTTVESDSERRCTYEHCERPGEGSQFLRIEEGTTTGGQDWSSVVGSVLCESCHGRFKRRGTLERAPPQIRSVGPCTYEHCERPGESRKFYQIEEGRTTGGQDWSSLVGSVLCESCHGRFLSRGTLERVKSQSRGEDGHDSKRQKRSDGKTGESRASQAGRIGGGEVRCGNDTSECMLCMGGRRTICVVPCGHLVLCGECGDTSLFQEPEGGSKGKEIGKKRPLSECPVCFLDMCAPWVMPSEEWGSLGGAARLLHGMLHVPS